MTPHRTCRHALPRTARLATLSLIGGVCLALAPAAAAEDSKPVYAPMGAPAEPKVVARWNRFYDYDQATQLLRQLARAHPDGCRLQSLGRSYGKRELWLLTVTDYKAGGRPVDKPGFWIDGGIHANEIQSVEVTLYTAWYLLEMRRQNEKIAQLLRQRVFYVCPMLSPDSRDAHFYRPHSTDTPRSGQRPVDDDLDGLIDEDGPDDLNGDGHITQMRVRDPNGEYRSHPDYPSLMVHVQDGQRGEFTLLGAEGFDNDGDGRVNEDGDGYYDPNRDWPWAWQPKYVQRGAYRYPLSVPENRCAAEFILSRPNIAGAQSYHNTGGMLLRGPGIKGEPMDLQDRQIFDTLAKTGAQMLPGYVYKACGEDLYPARGVEIDWFYQMRGVVAFTNELFTLFNYFRQTPQDGAITSDETRQKFDKYLLLGEGVVPWTEVDHPQYGKIEVGGLKKNWRRQPPSFLLEEECHRNMAFTLYHADQMPLVQVQSVRAETLDGDLHAVTAVIENSRLCPTRTAIDVQRKITPPDVVSIAGKRIRVVAGLISDERYFRNPAEQKYRPQHLRVSSVPGRGVVYVRWLVRGAGPYTVHVKSIKGGVDTQVYPAAAE